MKRIILCAIFLFVSAGFIYNKIIERTAKDILKQLELTDEMGKDYIWSNCSGNMFYWPSPKDLKNLAMGERASIVKAIGGYAKDYSKTPEFLQKYLEHKESMKPLPPQAPQSGDELRKEQKEQYIKSIEEMEKLKKSMPEDQQATFDEAVKTLKQQLKELDNPANNESYKQMDVMMKQGYEEQQKEYAEKLKQWEKEYPDNPNEMIKKWLTTFLETTKDVDFNAQLKEDGGRKLFVNPAYEEKDYLWKLCFRSGKETLKAGRDFASQWLKELH